MTSATPPRHAVLILAAGGSRRLGQAKQLLRAQGESLIRRTVALAAATDPVAIHVVIGAEQAAIRAELVDYPVKFVVNEQWRSGLASSLQAGAAALRDHSGTVLILVCDQLHLSLDHLQALLAVGRDRPGVCIASGYQGSVGIPVLATASLLQSAGELAADQGLKRQLQSGRWPLATIEAAELGFDLDTPEQCQDAVRRGWLDALTMP